MKRCLFLTMLLLNVAAAKPCAGGFSEGVQRPDKLEPEPKNFTASFVGDPGVYKWAREQKEKAAPDEKSKIEMQAWLAADDDGHSSEPIQSPRTSKVPAQFVGAMQQKLQEKIQEQKSDN